MFGWFGLDMGPSEQKQPKSVNTYRQKGWPDVVYGIASLLIARNLLLPAGALAFLLLAVYKLDSHDLNGLLAMIIDRKWFAVSGWVMFMGSVFVSIKITKWQSRIYRQRIDELEEKVIKLKQVQGQLNFGANAPQHEAKK